MYSIVFCVADACGTEIQNLLSAHQITSRRIVWCQESKDLVTWKNYYWKRSS